jgi:hypothetical protein
MSNRFIGYAVLIPTILGFVALFTIDIAEPLLSKIDEQVYFAVLFIVTICLFVGVIKLFWLPNREKQWIPIRNRILLFWTIIFFVIAGVSSEFDLGQQLEMLLGLISLIVIFTVSFRLITAPVEVDGEVQGINFIKELKVLAGVTLGIIVLLTLLVLMGSDTNSSESLATIETEEEKSIDEMIGEPLTEAELVSVVEDFLDIYQQLYYISQDDSLDAQTDSAIIASFLTEAMNDKNKLSNLYPKISRLVQHPNLMVRGNAASLSIGVNKLLATQEGFISYLRTVNPNTVDIAEFQYQFSLIDTETKDAYFTIIEGSTAMNLAFFEINSDGEDVAGEILIGTKSQQRLLDEIDRLFGDIFVEHEVWRKETGGTNAIVFVVQSWKDWIAELGPSKP